MQWRSEGGGQGGGGGGQGGEGGGGEEEKEEEGEDAEEELLCWRGQLEEYDMRLNWTTSSCKGQCVASPMGKPWPRRSRGGGGRAAGGVAGGGGGGGGTVEANWQGRRI